MYSVIYMLLAIYIERINPGEFGVAQPWNYLFRKSFWNPRKSSTIEPSDLDSKGDHRRIQDTLNDQVLILDEPTSGIDPHNRRLIWTIIRKLKHDGKCVILTTHFLEEADVLSDRIAFISKGRLQAHGTPDFLKQQTEYEYRIFMDKQETCDSRNVTRFIREHVKNAILERESASELVFGIKRDESNKIELLINALDQHQQSIGINSYGLSMTTIEDFFLKLIREEEKAEDSNHNPEKTRQILSNEGNNEMQEHIHGGRLFFTRLWALLVKRWHVTRRQITFLLGFFLLPIIFAIILVGVLPTPEEIQSTLLQNDRIIDAQVTLLPSIYNPQTIVTYSNNNESYLSQRLLNYLTNAGAIVDEILKDDVLKYLLPKYYQSADTFHLDEDVRIERESILQEHQSSASTVILVRDLVKQFTKRKEKSFTRRIYTAVDHLNFRVPTRSCFGANGAGKTTTFRMLIDDIKPTSDQHDGVLFCNVPFSSTPSLSNDKNTTASSFNLARIFAMLNARKNQKLIESYSLSQTTLEQIFVRLAGDDEDNMSTASSDKVLLNQTEVTNESK
ncbi:unnamed protein product [Rotaria sp. Silwood2]|nr:unnamed protein product [Rotaria sp. Silwood2]